MNILASVYACSPYDGSERAVGWNWICQLNKNHKVWALTSHVYKDDILDYKRKHPNELKNINFIFVEVPKLISSWHVGYRGERAYYIMWQYVAFKVAKKLVEDVKFDLVHHITYVTCILPTFMHKLNIPFLYGPVAGGENIPAKIKYPMSKKNKIIESFRYFIQLFFRCTPNFLLTMKRASLILVTTDETKSIIPRKYHYKTPVFQGIGLDNEILSTSLGVKQNKKCKILIAGRMIYWKGFDIAIKSFIKSIENGCNAELTVLGDTDDGSEEYKKNLEKICGKYLDKEIKFIPKIDHKKMISFYDEFDILLNCSLRDSGCFVVMEAMARALPIICVNTGGPKVNTTYENAIKIDPEYVDDMIDNISMAINKLVNDIDLRLDMGEKARNHAIEYLSMEYKAEKINKYYNFIKYR